MTRWRHRAVLVGIGAAIGMAAFTSTVGRVRAESDFWEAVRFPALRAYRSQVATARTALAARRWSEARQHAAEAIALLPERASAHVLLGRALGELSREEDALESFRVALSLGPDSLDDADSGGHAARIACLASDYRLAVRILRRVVARMRPSARRSTLYGLYGTALLALGPDQLSEALLALREAGRRGGPRDGPTSLSLALALMRQGEVEEALTLARGVASQGPIEAALGSLPMPDAERQARSALLFEAVGDLARAREAWRRAAEGTAWPAFTASRLRAIGP